MREGSARRSGDEAAHDILAAEEFAMPAPEPWLRRDVVLPGDAAGIPEPHDVLAAEEFAMPAPEPWSVGDRVHRSASPRPSRWAWLGGAAALALCLRRRRR